MKHVRNIGYVPHSISSGPWYFLQRGGHVSACDTDRCLQLGMRHLIETHGLLPTVDGLVTQASISARRLFQGGVVFKVHIIRYTFITSAQINK